MTFPQHIKELAQSVLDGVPGIEYVIHDALMEIEMPETARHFLFGTNHKHRSGHCDVARWLLADKVLMDFIPLYGEAGLIYKDFEKWLAK